MHAPSNLQVFATIAAPLAIINATEEAQLIVGAAINPAISPSKL